MTRFWFLAGVALTAATLAILLLAASSSASNPGLVAGLIGSGQSGTPLPAAAVDASTRSLEIRQTTVEDLVTGRPAGEVPSAPHGAETAGGGVPPHPRALTSGVSSEGGTMPPTTPKPAGSIGSVLIGGTSTWYCHDGSGGYPESRCTRGYEPGDYIAAAGSELPWGKGERVVVSRGDASVVVTIVDVCACQGSRVIDLSAAAFRELGSLGEGVIDVEVTSLPDLPATDTEQP